MTKRATSLRYPESAIAGGKFGTATVRESARPAMTAAQLAIFKMNGNLPQPTALDDAGVFDPFAPNPHGGITSAHIAEPKPARRSKYGNRKCELDGIQFDSEKERDRYVVLKQMQAAGLIRDLRLQVPYVLTDRMERDDGKWERAWTYTADFVYVDAATGLEVVEDVKSEATKRNRAYVAARKAMLKLLGISIKEF